MTETITLFIKPYNGDRTMNNTFEHYKSILNVKQRHA